jgi:predicted enzyme related to lactoylglutathione lyase
VSNRDRSIRRILVRATRANQHTRRRSNDYGTWRRNDLEQRLQQLASVLFYRDVVGLPVGLNAPGFTLFGSIGTPALGIGTHSEVRGKASDPYRHMVGLTTTDINADFARMKAAGAEFIEEPTLQPSGDLWIATFTDPEGNICQLFQFVSA